VFIHQDAEDNAKILKINYEATKLSIERAMKSAPTAAEITKQKDTVKHPFA
jgi:5,6,7,8-tetrahydromethanopterin hydro-lyase